MSDAELTAERMTAEAVMLIIKALDSDATVAFSEYTHKWYVSARIEVGDGVIVSGASEHRSSPDAAARAFFARLIDLKLDEYVVSTYHGKRREWRWNGAAFAECTRDVVFDREAETTAAVTA